MFNELNMIRHSRVSNDGSFCTVSFGMSGFGVRQLLDVRVLFLLGRLGVTIPNHAESRDMGVSEFPESEQI